MLELAVACAFTAFFLVELVRRVRPFQTWTLQGKRPWACNLCMSFWSGSVVVLALCLTGRPYDWRLHGFVDGLALFLLEWSGTFAPPAPPEFGG